MGNLLQNYQQEHVDRADYAGLLHTFAVTQRKDGKPYIAEAVNPFDGSWKGHDMENRSEHYFHSGFTDLIITGLAGLQTSESDTLVVNPLAPASWDYFALDRVHYHGHQISVIWDKTGGRYKAGKGLQVLVDGKKLASSPGLARLTVKLPALKVIPVDENPPMNYAVNNDGDYYPRYVASYVHPGSSLAKLSDGQYVYDIRPSNRWTTTGSPNGQDSLEVDFGSERPVDTVKLYVVDDGGNGEGKVTAPAKIQLAHWDGSAWKPVPDLKASAEVPLGGRPHTLSFPVLQTSRLRAVLTHAEGSRSGLTEFEAWGPGVKPYVPAPPPAGNIAFNRTAEGFPKASASHSDQFGGLAPRAIDGKIIFEVTPVNRWTCYGSPNATDSFEVDFGKAVKAGRAVLHIFDDRGGVQAPAAYTVEGWNGNAWQEMAHQVKSPADPTGNMANQVTFSPAEISKLRVVFTHKGNARSGMTEFEIWEK